jgi:Z1 domain
MASYVYNPHSKGFNIIIGGNSLGRGLTFPGLHTVYYLRTAKTPQADTSWQHSRMFGYDRIPGLCRVFLPPSLLHLFRELNEANQSMVKILEDKGLEDINLLSPRGTRPTRRNVLKANAQSIIIGGVNYFPQWPVSNKLLELDHILGEKDNETSKSLDYVIKLLALISTENTDSFDKKLFIAAIQALAASTYNKGCHLIVRTNRSVGFGTGTLLSPNDRASSDSFTDQLVVIFYRLNGEVEKGWKGLPLWVPNIKLPEGTNYCSAH